MHKVLYSKSELDLLSSLKNSTPGRVWGDGIIRCIFDYGDYHIYAMPDSLEAVAPHDKGAEAIQVNFERIDEGYEPEPPGSDRGEDELLLKDSKIERIWLLRTVLSFTDYQSFDSPEEALESTDVVSEDSDGKLKEVVSQAVGGFSEIICHPKSEEASGLPSEYINLVDTGALFDFGDEMLGVYSPVNAFNSQQKIGSPEEVLETVTQDCELIEIQDAT